MFPYIIATIISCSFFKIAIFINEKKGLGYKFFITLSLSPLIMLAAYRGRSVGTDTFVYIGFWQNVDLFSFENKSTFFSEPAFYLLQLFTKQISNNTFFGHEIFLGTITFIICILYLSTILRFSNYKIFSWIVFILLGYYTFHFNGARQAISVALFIFSLKFIINRSLTKFLLIILLGFLFHKTMLVCLPFYFLYGKKINFIKLFIIILLSILISIFMTSIIDVASEYDNRYANYANETKSGGGVVTVIFNSVLLIWLWVSKRLNSIDNKIYDLSLLMVLISVCIGWISVTLSLNPSGILRLSIYFMQFVIFSLPLSVMSYKYGFTKRFIIFSVIIFLCIYFYFTTTSFSGLTPYYSDFEFPF